LICPRCGEEIILEGAARKPAKLPASTKKIRQIFTELELALNRGVNPGLAKERALKKAAEFFDVYLRRIWFRGKRDIEAEIDVEASTPLNEKDLHHIDRIKAGYMEDLEGLADRFIKEWRNR